ncbi:MAG: hypothetical protein ACJ77F_12810 [Chloroflexota bacterium]
MTVDKLPATVSPGAPAGYRVTITNNGSSNIASLFLVDKVNGSLTVTPVYLTSSRPGTCNELGTLSGPLSCSFGALNAGDHVTVVVAYTTPTSGSSSSAEFQGSTSGATFSDTKGRSHGDTLQSDPIVTTTALNSGKNFAGGFSLSAAGFISNDANLNGNNRQSTGVKGLPAGFEATVEDGPGTTGTCTSTGPVPCTALFGEWSVVNVNGGSSVEGGFIVTIKFKTGTPTGFLHSFGNPVQQEAIGACPGGVAPATITDPGCFVWDAGTSTASIYTLHNGSYKGR